jgi:hypothetical protein
VSSPRTRCECVQIRRVCAELIRVQSLDSLISFTIDTWTDKDGFNFMSVTGHWIGAPPSSPQDWELRSSQLALTKVEGRHTGNNLSRIVVGVTDRYEIHDKVRESRSLDLRKLTMHVYLRLVGSQLTTRRTWTRLSSGLGRLLTRVQSCASSTSRGV